MLDGAIVMTEQADDQQPAAGHAAGARERRSARRVINSTIGNAAGMGGCFALFFAIVALCAGAGKIAAGQTSGLGAQLVREAATGLAVGVILGAIGGVWKAMGWPEWGKAIFSLSAVGAVFGAFMGWRWGGTPGAMVVGTFGAIIGAATGGVMELDLGMRAIRTMRKVVGRGREGQSRRHEHV
jgi:hypothetical protein